MSDNFDLAGGALGLGLALLWWPFLWRARNAAAAVNAPAPSAITDPLYLAIAAVRFKTLVSGDEVAIMQSFTAHFHDGRGDVRIIVATCAPLRCAMR